jgi:signal transduction histidine kinase
VGCPINPASACCAFGWGGDCHNQHDGLMAVVIGSNSSGVLARRLLLAPVIIPTMTGWLKVFGQWCGVYDAQVAAWLFAFLNVSIFTLVIWWSARLLHRAEFIQQRADNEIRNLNADLEKRVEHRTVQLSRAMDALAANEQRLEQLVQERTAKLEEVVSDLEAFSYSVSHDLRAPLRAMQGFAGIVLDEFGPKLEPACANHLKRIQSSGHRMERLISDLLAYSQVTRGELELQLLNPEACIRSIVESYPNLQDCDVRIDGPLPWVRASEAAFTQCIANLLGNAAKFVASGVKPVIRIWAESRPGWTRLLFKDNGIGIPHEEHQRLFKMFQRANTSHEGTGIGLAIVKRATERMGGQVGLASAPGQGSTFWVELSSAEKAGTA